MTDLKRIIGLSGNQNGRKHYVTGQPIGIGRIEIPAGRRHANPDVVKAIAESIKVVGLLHPIRVREINGRVILVTGLHRLEAYKKLGLGPIPAVLVDATDDEAAIAEIDENLCRLELSDAEIAAVVARRKAIYERLHPETAHGGDRRSSPQIEDLNRAPKFTDDTAAKTGKSRQTVERAARRGRELGPDTLERITGTTLDKGVELDALVKLSPEERAPIIEKAERGEKVSVPRPPRKKMRRRRIERLAKDSTRAFVIVARDVERLAVYTSLVTEDVAKAARKAADAWSMLADVMETALHSRSSEKVH
jgi:ParB family transcriptional regulator, chromosome partitioning protein